MHMFTLVVLGCICAHFGDTKMYVPTYVFILMLPRCVCTQFGVTTMYMCSLWCNYGVYVCSLSKFRKFSYFNLGQLYPKDRPQKKCKVLLDDSPKIWGHKMCQNLEEDSKGGGTVCWLQLQPQRWPRSKVTYQNVSKMDGLSMIID